MAKRTIHTCDLCGREVRGAEDLREVRIPALMTDCYGNESVCYHAVEMCDACRTAYEALLINDFAEIHLDAFGCPTQPVVLKLNEDKRYEELSAEHLREVLELEEELERLRDVKDQLFETNFKLTALLRAHGIEVDE